LVNGIFRGRRSEEPRGEMLGTGPALVGPDSPKRLISRHKAEMYNMVLEVRKRHGSKGLKKGLMIGRAQLRLAVDQQFSKVA
jgi:hypothetical protein